MSKRKLEEELDNISNLDLLINPDSDADTIDNRAVVLGDICESIIDPIVNKCVIDLEDELRKVPGNDPFDVTWGLVEEECTFHLDHCKYSLYITVEFEKGLRRLSQHLNRYENERLLEKKLKAAEEEVKKLRDQLAGVAAVVKDKTVKQ